MRIQDILALNDTDKIIEHLKKKTNKVPKWKDLREKYDPSYHPIKTDTATRRDRMREDGVLEIAARRDLGFEELLVNKFTQMMFTLPVKREYKYVDEKHDKLIEAVEKVYDRVHINTINMNRFLQYFKTCEIFTIWYAIPEENDLYGFHSSFKLRCKTYTPEEGYELYPLFDELDDMIAMSLAYDVEEEEDIVEAFETYTAGAHYKWLKRGDKWENVLSDVYSEDEESKPLMKIPGVYVSREKAVYELAVNSREEIEYKMSENSDVLSYNSSPVLKVVGDVVGNFKKGAGQKEVHLKNGGDVGYVSWAQAVEALRFHVEKYEKIAHKLTQMPDLSFENMKGLGNVGYDARELMFMDMYLKIGQESKSLQEFLTRESNIVLAFLAKMNTQWEKLIDDVYIENLIVPYRLKDLAHTIEVYQKANGGKPLITHQESVEKAGLTDDAEAVVNEYKEEEQGSVNARMDDIFGGGASN